MQSQVSIILLVKARCNLAVMCGYPISEALKSHPSSSTHLWSLYDAEKLATTHDDGGKSRHGLTYLSSFGQTMT